MIQPNFSLTTDPKLPVASLKDHTERFIFTKLYHVLYNFNNNIEIKKKNNFSYGK